MQAATTTEMAQQLLRTATKGQTPLTTCDKPAEFMIGPAKVTVAAGIYWKGHLPEWLRRAIGRLAGRLLDLHVIAGVKDQPPRADVAAAIAAVCTPSRN